MAYEFHYTPTGTGVISGKEVLEQTEDAINDLGNTAISGVQEALDKAEQALTNSENAVDDAQTALNTANNAEGVAIQAQTDVGNLSGTVTNIGNRVTTAEGNISNLQGRMTTAEGNITNLQGRMTTAESNIGNLQTAVSTAQATANSAQQTATTARQQSYVFRYSGTAVVPNSTIAYSTIDNTDNIKAGDKILDVDGKLFEITAVDTTNQTVTVGSALIDLALDANVVHTSDDETVGGTKTFDSNTYIYNSDTNATTPNLFLKNSKVSKGSTSETGAQLLNFVDKNNFSVGELESIVTSAGATELRIRSNTLDSNNQNVQTGVTLMSIRNGAKRLCPTSDNDVFLGVTTLKWARVYSTQYYYGNDNVEFSTKFVTTDTAQTISGVKTFSDIPVFSTFDGIRFRCAHNSNAYVTFRSSNQANPGSIIFSANDGNVGTAFHLVDKTLIPYTNSDIDLGTSLRKWKSLNGINPGALSLPNLSNGIDISSYITVVANANKESLYTPPANGWISVALTRSGGANMAVLLKQGNFASSGHNIALENGTTTCNAMLPVKGGVQVSINSALADGIAFAYFYPCQGNI